jgi:hypothetical protein
MNCLAEAGFKDRADMNKWYYEFLNILTKIAKKHNVLFPANGIRLVFDYNENKVKLVSVPQSSPGTSMELAANDILKAFNSFEGFDDYGN